MKFLQGVAMWSEMIPFEPDLAKTSVGNCINYCDPIVSFCIWAVLPKHLLHSRLLYTVQLMSGLERHVASGQTPMTKEYSYVSVC